MNPSYLVGNRLKEERERLGLLQADAAQIAGVSREMWGRYERGALPGGDVLMALGNAEPSQRMDVLYILTGQRSQAVSEVDLLSPQDRILLDNFHHAPAAVQAGIKTALGAFAPGDISVGERRAG